MEPQHTDQPSVTDNQQSFTSFSTAPLHQVTSTSKILAAVIFITLPFVGGYVGYMCAPEKVTEVQIPMPTVIESNELVILPEMNTQEVVNETAASDSLDTALINLGTFIHPVDGVDKVSTISNLQYIEKNDWSEYVKNETTFSKINTIENVTFKNFEDDYLPGQEQDFVALLASTSEYMIFCRLPFEKGGTCNGLLKFSFDTETLTEMKVSDIYNPFYMNGTLSPNGTKIASVSEIEIGYIDLINDVYVSVSKLDPSSATSYIRDCEYGCITFLEWISDTVLKTRVYEYDSCVSKQSEYFTERTCTPYNTEKFDEVTYSII